MFDSNLQTSLYLFVTMDATWLYHYASELKQQSNQWTRTNENVLKKAKTILSEGICKKRNVVTFFFWNVQGIILINCLKKYRNNKSSLSCSSVGPLKDELKEKCSRFVHKSIYSFTRTMCYPTNLQSQCKTIQVRFQINSSSTPFPGIGLMWLLPVPQLIQNI